MSIAIDIELFFNPPQLAELLREYSGGIYTAHDTHTGQLRIVYMEEKGSIVSEIFVNREDLEREADWRGYLVRRIRPWLVLVADRKN